MVRNVKLHVLGSVYRIVLEPPAGEHVNLTMHTVHGNATFFAILHPQEQQTNVTKVTTFSLKVHDSYVHEGFSVFQISKPEEANCNLLFNRSSFAHPSLFALALVNVTLSSCSIDRCIFSDDLLVTNVVDYPIQQAPIVVTNSTFQDLTFIWNGRNEKEFGYNMTLRGNVFPPNSALGLSPFIDVSPQNSPFVWVDARGNYWGDPTGPHSCCEPTALGASNIWADSSPFCLDEDCESLSSPLGNDSLFGIGFSPAWCRYEQLCNPTTDAIQYALIGCFIGMFVLACLASLTYYLRTRTGAERDALLVQDIPGQRHRLLYIFDVCGGIFACLTAVVTFLPTLYLPRSFAAALAVRNWAIYASVFLLVLCILRVICNVWNVIVLRKFQETYRTLLGNVVFSGVIVVLSIMWRFSSWALLPVVERPVFQDMVLRSEYYWIVTGLFAGAEFFFAIPAIFMSLNILKQRDYAEVEGLKQTLSGSPLGEVNDLLQSQQLRRVSTAGFASCVFLTAVYIALIPTSLYALLPVPAFSDVSHDRLLAISLCAHFAACTIVTVFGSFYFRRRPYDPTYGTVFFASSLATVAMLIEVVVYTSIEKYSSLRHYAPALATMIIATLAMCAPSGMTAWNLIRLRRTLASDVARNVYAKLQNQLAE